MEEKKKSNIGIILLVIVLLCAAFVGGFYLAKSGLLDKKETVQEKEKIEKLDVDSRLVQSLYRMVTPEVGGCYRIYLYGDGKGDNNFYADKAPEIVKMKIVLMNLSSNDGGDLISCEEAKLPNTIKAGDMSYGSPCIDEKLVFDSNKHVDYTNSFKRNHVEEIYKKIFGSDAKLDTSVDLFPYNPQNPTVWRYFSNIDEYVQYTFPGGGTCGPQEYEGKIISAEKDGKYLRIIENEKYTVTSDGNDGAYGTDDDVDTTTDRKYTFTFELEDDGMYKFVSREKNKE